MALTTTCLEEVAGLFLLESYFLISGHRSLVCKIFQFDPHLGWETEPRQNISNAKLTYKTNALEIRFQEVDYKKDYIPLAANSLAFGLGLNNDEIIFHQ